jgi:MerR family transcriptional regulator, light-induced transcriptional regulator
MERAEQKQITVSIAAVERDTGIGKDTLRVWERRYGFPTPERDEYGERAYTLEQVDKLRVIRRLMDGGHRPGKIVGYSLDELQALASTAPSGPEATTSAGELQDLRSYLEIVKLHDPAALKHALSQTLLRVGIERFVVDTIAPLNSLVGEAWMRGYFEVFEEHLYTECVQVILRQAISSIPPAKDQHGPRVLLTTISQEPHGLGLLMAEAVLSLEGAQCTSLGTQTPINDIVLAANARRADVVALSFSSTLKDTVALQALSELRAKLASNMEIWAGGACAALHRGPIEGVTTLSSLAEIRGGLNRWRARSR